MDGLKVGDRGTMLVIMRLLQDFVVGLFFLLLVGMPTMAGTAPK
jgi:hypothetical protein